MGGRAKTVNVRDPASERRPFNCHDQSTAIWHERAALCVDLIASLDFRRVQERSIADVGCGDRKLEEALHRKGFTCRYQGYDILPQSREVLRFDVQSEILPPIHDVVVLLGVVEYLTKPEQVFVSLAQQAPWLLVSHVVRQDVYYTDARRAELGWRNHFTSEEITRMLERNGFTVVRDEMTSDKRTLLMVCRSLRFRPAPAAGSK